MVGRWCAVSIETLLPYLAGPGAGLLVCLLVGAGVYRLVVLKLLPLVESTVARHLQQIDAMATRHNEWSARCALEHAAILEAVRELREYVAK